MGKRGRFLLRRADGRQLPGEPKGRTRRWFPTRARAEAMARLYRKRRRGRYVIRDTAPC